MRRLLLVLASSLLAIGCPAHSGVVPVSPGTPDSYLDVAMLPASDDGIDRRRLQARVASTLAQLAGPYHTHTRNVLKLARSWGS